MREGGKRIFNSRPICFFALFLAFGIGVGEAFLHFGNYFRFIPLGVFMFLTALLLIFHKFRKFAYIPLAALVGFVSICGCNDVFAHNTLEERYSGTINGTVASEIIVGDGRTSFYIDGISFSGVSENGDEKVENLALKGKSYVILYYETVPDFGAGDTVKISGKISSNQHKAFDSYYAYEVSNSFLHFVSASDVEKIADGTAKFPLNVQIDIKRMFYENTDEYTASICQSLLLGDKRGIDGNLYDDVRISGLAHILAVSGLHITALSTALYFVLKKIRIKPLASLISVTALTFVFVMLCGFTASAVRAFIMSFVFNFASSFGFKSDNLSALAFACVLILLLSPTSIFDIGFLLSVFAVLGIFLFYRTFEAVGMRAVDAVSPKRRIGKSVVKSFSMSMSSSLAAYPFLAVFFGSVPTLFLISNLFMVPYMNFAFIVLLITTVFAAITGLSGIVKFMYYLFLPFKAFVSAVGDLSFASLDTAISVAGVFLFVLCMLLVSRFVFLKRNTKLKYLLMICACWLAVAAVSF